VTDADPYVMEGHFPVGHDTCACGSPFPCPDVQLSLLVHGSAFWAAPTPSELRAAQLEAALRSFNAIRAKAQGLPWWRYGCLYLYPGHRVALVPLDRAVLAEGRWGYLRRTVGCVARVATFRRWHRKQSARNAAAASLDDLTEV